MTRARYPVFRAKMKTGPAEEAQVFDDDFWITVWMSEAKPTPMLQTPHLSTVDGPCAVLRGVDGSPMSVVGGRHVYAHTILLIGKLLVPRISIVFRNIGYHSNGNVEGLQADSGSG